MFRIVQFSFRIVLETNKHRDEYNTDFILYIKLYHLYSRNHKTRLKLIQNSLT